MSEEIKAGDKVRLVHMDICSKYYRQVGEVVSIDLSWLYPVCVRMPDDTCHNYFFGELQKVKEVKSESRTSNTNIW